MKKSASAPTKRQPSTESGIPPEQKVLTQASIRCAGVVGLGHMGEAFARNLIADGYQVTVYDLSQARMELLKSGGAKVASELADLAPCQVVLTFYRTITPSPRSRSTREDWSRSSPLGRSMSR